VQQWSRDSLVRFESKLDDDDNDDDYVGGEGEVNAGEESRIIDVTGHETMYTLIEEDKRAIPTDQLANSSKVALLSSSE
jgi:hypothetical protein